MVSWKIKRRDKRRFKGKSQRKRQRESQAMKPQELQNIYLSSCCHHCGCRLSTPRGASLMHQHYLLDLCATGEARTPLAVAPPVAKCSDGSEKPQQSIGEVDPYGVLHSLDAAVALRICVDVHLYSSVSDTALFWGILPCWGSPTFPKTPNKAIQRMKRIKFHIQTKANRKMNGIM